MKIADLIKTYHLEELLKLASGECNNDISDSLLFILDDNKCIKEEYKNFYKNNKNRKGEKI
ncbi:hypothetical protein SAMN04324257_00217 [Thermoanaerobacter thermohydrosulfuricus]|nr:hypothetical protein SAMN04324257_00217 [Thermoanaerobacter thermohydrosulfuricus]